MVTTSQDVFNLKTTVQQHKELREALNTTCKLHEANNTLAKITIEDQTDYDILRIMSEKSLEDACEWVSSTLNTGFNSSYRVHCDNSSLTDLCSQWNDVIAIQRVEDKVDILRNAYSDSSTERDVDETAWINAQQFNSSSTFFTESYNCTEENNVLTC